MENYTGICLSHKVSITRTGYSPVSNYETWFKWTTQSGNYWLRTSLIRLAVKLPFLLVTVGRAAGRTAQQKLQGSEGTEYRKQRAGGKSLLLFVVFDPLFLKAGINQIHLWLWKHMYYWNYYEEKEILFYHESKTALFPWKYLYNLDFKFQLYLLFERDYIHQGQNF